MTLALAQACSSNSPLEEDNTVEENNEVVELVNNPYLLPNGGGPQTSHLRTFGDSYSTPGEWGGSWGNRLKGMGRLERNSTYAVGGARAAGGFDSQVSRYLRQDGTFGARDLTVVYFGYNDIGRTGSPDGLVNARAGYDSGIQRLINAGAITGEQRLFVTQLHDWARGPGVSDGVRSQVQEWNGHVAHVANTHPNIVAVDLFTVFEDVYANPAKYGLVDVANANRSRAATDFLYFDEIHFGGAGLNIIARTYNHYLTRGWSWANTLAAGGIAAGQLQSDIDSGLLTFRLQDSADRANAAFQALPLGPAGEERGIGLNWQPQWLSNQTTVGVALFNDFRSLNAFPDDAAMRRQSLNSDGLGTWLSIDAGPVNSTTQIMHLTHSNRHRANDALLDRSVHWTSESSSMSAQQRFDKPFEIGNAVLVPWAAITHRSLSMAPVDANTLYTSKTRVSIGSHQQVTGGLGMTALGRTIDLGYGRGLQLGTSIEWEQSLYQNGIEVTYQEQNLPGVVQRENVNLGSLQRASIGLNAALFFNEHSSLDFRFTHVEGRDSYENEGMISWRHQF
jgi:hypothetical protein